MTIHTYIPVINLTRPLPFFFTSTTLVASKLIYIYCPPLFTPNLIAKIHNLYLFQNYPYLLVFTTFTIFPSTLRWCCILFHLLFLFTGNFISETTKAFKRCPMSVLSNHGRTEGTYCFISK